MKLFHFISIFLLVASLILIGCSSKDDSNDNTTERTIGAEGGTIEISGDVSLYVPASALSENVDFKIERNSSPMPIGSKIMILDDSYIISPDGTNFSLPATITIYYNESELGSASESDIVIYSDTGSGWIQLTTTVNNDDNRASALVYRLSEFCAAVDTSTDIIIGPNGGYFWVTNVLRFDIPTGALSENVEFTLAWTSSPAPIGGNAVFVSAPVTIGPAGTNFALPATIRLNYNEDYLRGGNEADIEVYTDLGTGWIPLTTTVNIDSNIASAMVNHLSDFVTAVDTPTTTEVSIYAH